MSGGEAATLELRRRGPLGTVLHALPGYWKLAAGFSVAVNLLMLVSPLYMIQIYDRVLTSGSLDTLWALTLLAVFLLCIQSAADGGRRRALALAGKEAGEALDGKLFRHALVSGRGGNLLTSSTADLARIQGFLVNGQIVPFLDLPFAPLFVLLCFFINPLVGVVTLVGTIALVVLAVIAERTTREASLEANAREQLASRYLSGIARQYSAITAMGI